MNGAAWFTRRLGLGVNVVDRNVIDGAINEIGQATGAVGGVLKRVQSGKVQQYAAVLFAVVAILTLVFTAFR